MAKVAVDVEMNELAFKVLNGPVCIFNLVAYVFYASCLFCHRDGAEVLNQLLKVLLAILVTFMPILQIVSLFYLVLDSSAMSWQLFDAFNLIQFYFFLCSLTTVVWLNVFYYTQIVPPHNTFSIRLKKNIRSVAYSVIVSDKLFFLVDMAMYGVPAFSFMNSINSTLTSSNTTTLWHSLELPRRVFYISRVVYIFLSLMVMTASSCATVSYLRRHLKSMKSSRSPFTSSLQSQKRVAITGIVQIVLYFLCATWFLLEHLLANICSGLFDGNNYILTSVFSLYSFGTAINLGIGQSLFRRRTASLCHKMSKFLNL